MHAVNESGQTRVPVTVSARGTVLTGILIAQDAYFTQLAEGSPLLGALQPASGLLGKEYTSEVSRRRTIICTSRHWSRRRTVADQLDAVDGWTLGAGEETQDAKGPFARLLGT